VLAPWYVRSPKEVRALENLVQEAATVMTLDEESKLKALRSCLENVQFRELTDGRGKLLIFTEHRDTLEYLRRHLQQWGYTTCEIHGGMNAVLRREAAQCFHEAAQVCLATEAAGEGINLQFCHLMINYDIPWNPNRLEQRMGRIHRIGQRSDVYIFNFVATNTIEGVILQRLFTKLEEIRGQLGDRVFDVVGQLLALNELRLEEMLREAAINPAHRRVYRADRTIEHRATHAVREGHRRRSGHFSGRPGMGARQRYPLTRATTDARICREVLCASRRARENTTTSASRWTVII